VQHSDIILFHAVYCVPSAHYTCECTANHSESYDWYF